MAIMIVDVEELQPTDTLMLKGKYEVVSIIEPTKDSYWVHFTTNSKFLPLKRGSKIMINRATESDINDPKITTPRFTIASNYQTNATGTNND